jgi:hypothetical protein
MLSERVLIVNWTTPVPLWELAVSDLEVWPSSARVRGHLEHARTGGSHLLLDLDSLAGPRSLSQVRHLLRSDQIRSDQIRQIRSDQSRAEQIRLAAPDLICANLI